MPKKTKHTLGDTYAPSSERIGGPEVAGAGHLRMAGDIYANPQAKKTKIKMGGNFEGGANSYKPPKMSIEKEGE
jgi:hypothetical protein